MSTVTPDSVRPDAAVGGTQGTGTSNRGYKPSYGDDDVIDLGRIFGLLVDAKWFLLAVIALVGGGAYFYGTVATPVYQGDALIQVERRGSLNPFQDVNDMLMGGSEGAATGAEVQILQSRMILGEVVRQLDLQTQIEPMGFGLLAGYLRRQGMERPGWAASSASVWAGESVALGRFEVARAYEGRPLLLVVGEAGRFSLQTPDGAWLADGAVGELVTAYDGALQLRVAALTASPGATWQVRRLSELAAINRLKGELELEELSGRGNATGMIRLLFRGESPEAVKQTLDGIAEVFMRQNVERQAEQAERSLQFLQGEAPKLRGELARAEEALNDYRIRVDSVDLSSEAQATLSAFIDVEKQINEIEYEEAEVAELFEETHPRYQSLLRRRAFLSDRRADLESRINKLPVDQQEVVRLTRDVEVSQQIYVGLLNRTQELEIAKAGTIGNVRIIDEAVVAPEPVEPERSKLTAIAAMLAAFVAAGLVLLRAMFNKGIEVPEQLEQLGLSIYATVPKSQAGTESERRTRKGVDGAEGNKTDVHLLTRLGLNSGRRRRKPRALLAELDPTDNSLEALRGFRTALHFALMEGDHKVVAISGASPGVGKTFISCNLAAVYAQAGQRVLVIDTDMRRGHVHTMFRGGRTPGLSEYLAGDIEVEPALQKSRIENLSFIARGTVPPNPSELLMSSRFSALLAVVREQFDVVIVDTPPVLPVTDGAIAAKACDGVFLVAQFDRTTPKDVELSLSRLEASGAKVKGAVLNQVERKASSYYGYYGYYNYQYSYRYRSETL